MIFAPVQNLVSALAGVPREQPLFRILRLLDQAVRRDVHLIDRHQTPRGRDGTT
jgi:hypothetical protein